MLFNDLRQLLILLLICMLAILAIKAAHQIAINRYAKRKSISFGLYSAYRYLLIDAIAQVFIFLFFDWHIALVLWLVTIPLGFWLFAFLQKTEIYAKKYNRFVKKQCAPDIPQDKMEQQAVRRWEHQYRQQEDVQFSLLYNTAISTPTHHINWLSIHLSAPLLLWISIILEEASLLPAPSLTSSFGRILYDILCSHGICSIVYWGGYIGDALHYRYDGWLRWYHIGYSVFWIIWWVAFVFVEMYML